MVSFAQQTVEMDEVRACRLTVDTRSLPGERRRLAELRSRALRTKSERFGSGQAHPRSPGTTSLPRDNSLTTSIRSDASDRSAKPHNSDDLDGARSIYAPRIWFKSAGG